MKKVVFVSLLMAFSVGTAAFAATAPAPAKTKVEQACKGEHKDCPEKAVYTCSMHPDVKSNKPGKCPKCGMILQMKKMDMSHMKHMGKSQMKHMDNASCPSMHQHK